MFKGLILALALVASATAFAPIAAPGRTAVAQKAAVDQIISGAQEEVGGVWDPLGLGNDEAKLYRRRVVELKHGRICMLATVGILVQVRAAAAAAAAHCRAAAGTTAAATSWPDCPHSPTHLSPSLHSSRSCTSPTPRSSRRAR